MEVDAFSSRLGEGQGRIQPTTVSPSAGAWAFVLGDDQPGRFFELRVGDGAQVVQGIDLTGLSLVRTQVTLRVPGSLNAGFAWEVSLIVDGAKRATATARPGRTRAITDMAANVSKLAGVHQVGVRLELVTA